ncbi:feline leukemia virus subgroup C receptor-related protein 2-like [Anoplophora glabripennis]|uniref:feline leukemia virus subgroup C receptor-related protein 2-like n=1 Tax=Anoplophora glabripennis TaxID=217634 RepID=UPI0008750829|nr:feline leukemia virus subgroup C receptor-related protein 2-like [Anoplophora glabripennis]XP_018570610.1 feline leukemia virus subgroup C receptor-related protein 2-like [Anoplophora glabripennis]XP_018570611.1 feline leukemia virus subgroup C receptor-related protein 2-like [Anoplophora glabripennis]
MEMDAQTATLVDIKVYKYRWVVLLIFCLSTIVNFMQFLQFTIIANIVTKFYNVDTIAVDATGLIFFLAYIVLFLPVSYSIERYNMKVTLIISTGLTLIGNVVKMAGAEPNKFYVIMIGQAFCAVGQIFVLSIPSKVASVWFGANEVSTACAIAVLGTQLGAAIGSVLPPFLVKSDNDSDVGDNLYNMMMVNAILSCVVFVIVIVFFRARPDIPPSQSQLQILQEGEELPPFFHNFKGLVKNKNYLLLLLSFGIFNSIWNSFGIVINTIYTHYFPDGEHDVGIITLSAIISGGCIGSVIFGLILDKTHQFKRTSIGVMLASIILYVVAITVLTVKSKVGSYIAIPTFGFFAASGLIISFEYTLEETYPVPETVSCSVMNATIFLFAIIFALIAEALFDVIGILNTSIIIMVIYLFSTGVLFFAKANLRRRDANVAS